MNIKNVFNIGETVYLVTDVDQNPRLIYGFVIHQSEILYKVICGTQQSENYDFELSREKNVLLKVS